MDWLLRLLFQPTYRIPSWSLATMLRWTAAAEKPKNKKFKRHSPGSLVPKGWLWPQGGDEQCQAVKSCTQLPVCEIHPDCSPRNSLLISMLYMPSGRWRQWHWQGTHWCCVAPPSCCPWPQSSWQPWLKGNPCLSPHGNYPRWCSKESTCQCSRLPETQVWSPGREDPLEEETATHSSTLAWRSPWTEEPGGLQSMGSQRVRHDWAWAQELHWDNGPEVIPFFF